MAKRFKRDKAGKFTHSKVAERTDVADDFGLVGTVIEDDVPVDRLNRAKKKPSAADIAQWLERHGE